MRGSRHTVRRWPIPLPTGLCKSIPACPRYRADIRIAYPENANHVLKFEPEPRAGLTAAKAMASYSAAITQLDPEVVELIVTWLTSQSRPKA
jgi:hypothetical protein